MTISAPPYLDYAATTPVDPRTIAAMVECLGIDGVFGNPASNSHQAGMAAHANVEQARRQVAGLIGSHSDEIVWTSGATESTNLALKGFADATGNDNQKRHIVTSRIEHKATLDTAAHLVARGFTVTYLAPDSHGEITPEAVAAALRPDTGLVSLMMVNNEIGTLTDIARIAPLVSAAGALLHVDAAQAVGKTPVDVEALGIDLMSVSAHKLYGPKGVGVLYVRKAIAHRITAQIHGGGHERGLRSGTLPTHQIVGMGSACALALAALEADTQHVTRLQKRLLQAVLALEGVSLNAAEAQRIPHTVNLTIAYPNFFPFLLSADLALSSTSACNSAAGKASHVLLALGLSEDLANRSVRVSMGRFTTEADIDIAISCLCAAVRQCQLVTT
jgi:cysteine desulfurase